MGSTADYDAIRTTVPCHAKTHEEVFRLEERHCTIPTHAGDRNTLFPCPSSEGSFLSDSKYPTVNGILKLVLSQTDRPTVLLVHLLSNYRMDTELKQINLTRS